MEKNTEEFITIHKEKVSPITLSTLADIYSASSEDLMVTIPMSSSPYVLPEQELYQPSLDVPYAFGIPSASPILTIDDASMKKQVELENEIERLKKEVYQKTKELKKAIESKGEQETISREREKSLKKLKSKEGLQHLTKRVNKEAMDKLFDSEDFRKLFKTYDMFEVIVMSIDIRRSTELMLKAKEPKLYAKFITSFCKELSVRIVSNYGIFDKFTGDGILAFFPDFYSGPDAIYYALKSADECHRYFYEHYKKYRKCFTTILKDVGLGIGIDYGKAYLTNINDEITVVGTPVVYACRMGGAEAGETLLNQPAYEKVTEKYEQHLKVEETEINLKHEGRALAYKVNLNFKAIDVEPPNWEELTEKYSKKDGN